jgi:putative PIN family toxin of toxin-antitoxin system
MKVILDTNVVISAILFGGTPKLILNSALEGTIEAYITDAMLEELETVLRRPKFGLPRHIVQSILNEIANIATWIEPQEKSEIVKSDPDDNIIIDCAIAAEAEFLITGDKHLLELQEYKGIKIITTKDFLQEHLER